MPGYTPDNDGTFDAEFKIAIPEMQSATRSFAEPKIENLWLFIFDSSGYISQALEVTNSEVGSITPESTDNTWEDNKATEFTVKGIAETSYSRTIHLIANLPAGTVTNGFFAESNFISSLKTSGIQDAYWQRVEMPNGITQATIDALGVIPMVRNYAKVSSRSDLTAFTLEGLILTNVPNSGSVAPYHTNTLGLESGVLALLNGNFANYRATDADGAYTGGATDYAALEAQEYNGFEPSGVTYSDQAVPATWQTYQYLYERDHSETEKRTYAILKGTWNDGTTTKSTYYKVDIVKESGDAYNLLRNIEYQIVVKNVTGWGFDSAEDAIASPAVSNNLAFNVETRDLLNVSDGTSRLFIEYSRKVITAGNSQITFRYRYVPDIKSPKVSQNVTGNNVTISWSDFASGVKLGDAVIADGNPSADGVNWVSNTQLAADSDGYIWNEVTFNVADVGDEAKIQEFTLSAKNEKTGATLSRVVELRLVKPFKFSIDVAPKVDDGAGKAVPTWLTLPKGLPKGIFPLTFNVVCGNGSLTSSLPVVTGLDINGMPNADGKYFGYAVTIDYDNYDSDNGTILRPEFSTNMANAAKKIGEQTNTNQKDATNNGTKVRAYNPYFEPDFSQFWIGSLYAMSFDNNTLTVEYGIGNSVEATLRINSTSIADPYWSTDENGKEYLDIVFSDSNNSLTLSDVSVAPNVADNFGNALRIYRTGFEGVEGVDGISAYPLTFTTKKFVSATTITAYNEDFTPASATLTNKSFGQLGISVTKGATLVPGAGQTVTVKVTVPDDAEAAFDGDKLELTLTTSAAYLANPNPVETSATISGSDTNFTVVVPKSEYDKAVYTYSFAFTTTAGNTAATRTITVSHPYLDSASAQTKTAKLSFTAININGSTSQQTIHGTGKDVKVNVTLPNDIPEALFANGGLVLTLTATQSTLNADSGTSGSGTTFTKTVTYAEYTSNKVVTFDFTTNEDNVGTTTFWGSTYAKTTSVTVSNPNFNDSTSLSFKTENKTN